MSGVLMNYLGAGIRSVGRPKKAQQSYAFGEAAVDIPGHPLDWQGSQRLMAAVSHSNHGNTRVHKLPLKRQHTMMLRSACMLNWAPE